MAKLFTITEGLQNMGALRTGGQGSVYKAKRIGEIIVAVKLLPTPIQTESDEDKNYRAFRNEVEKLQKVNEVPNPHVVKILSWGITESGSFPFIEMEFIEGPDLAELLNPPHDPVFSIAAIIKVADQLANALRHCHTRGIRHGDIKSNNVKCNSRTGNYMLLDFGLAVMTDEQRRSSLQHAGAVEFMAPEQSEGTLLLQSDIYSYGIILYELLAGTVPYPAKDNGHVSRNAVMVAHLEAQLPDALELRKSNLPPGWSAEKQEMEMQVPEWLLSLIYKCLEKDPAKRFANGTELYEAIIRQQSGLAIKSDVEGALLLQNEKEQLQAALVRQQEKVQSYEQEISSLKNQLETKSRELDNLKKSTIHQVPAAAYSVPQTTAPVKHTSNRIWVNILLLLIAAGAIAAYFLLHSGKSNKAKPGDTAQQQTVQQAPVVKKKLHSRHVATHRRSSSDTSQSAGGEVVAPATTLSNGKVYTLATTYAYFHNSPDAASRRKANINRWNNARLTALAEENGYIYVVYTNEQGQISRGWLDKRDLKVVR